MWHNCWPLPSIWLNFRSRELCKNNRQQSHMQRSLPKHVYIGHTTVSHYCDSVLTKRLMCWKVMLYVVICIYFKQFFVAFICWPHPPHQKKISLHFEVPSSPKSYFLDVKRLVFLAKTVCPYSIGRRSKGFNSSSSRALGHFTNKHSYWLAQCFPPHFILPTGSPIG